MDLTCRDCIWLEKFSRKTTRELGFPPEKTRSHPAGGYRRELQVGTWITSLWANYAPKPLVLIPSTCLSAEGTRVQKKRETLRICLEIISQKQLFGAQVFPTHYLCGKADVDRGALCSFCCYYKSHSGPHLMIWTPKFEYLLCFCLAKAIQWFGVGPRYSMTCVYKGLFCFKSTLYTTK